MVSLRAHGAGRLPRHAAHTQHPAAALRTLRCTHMRSLSCDFLVVGTDWLYGIIVGVFEDKQIGERIHVLTDSTLLEGVQFSIMSSFSW